MQLYADIRKGYHEYLIYVQKNSRIQLPEHIHDPQQSIGKVHASALGRCPLASAKKRQQEVQMDLSTLHLMQQGMRDAEPLQEAMLWYDPRTQVEFSVERGVFRGRIDILYNGHVIEIKRRDGYMKNPPQPKLTDVYQMLAYHYITGITSIHLCLMTRFDLFFWRLEPRENGFVLLDEQGNEWKNAANKPSYLNFGVLHFEAKRHMEYLEGRTDDPMPNFLEIPAGAECFHWESAERPKKYKTTYNGETERRANIVPHCPFWCHCKVPSNGLIEIEELEYGSKSYNLIAEQRDPLAV